MDDSRPSPFRNGFWSWDQVTNNLLFVNRDKEGGGGPRVHGTGSGFMSSSKQVTRTIKFKESVDTNEQANFRKNFRRKVKVVDANVVTVQDLKDLALFLASRTDLSIEFIGYFHTEKVDGFLRSIIVYFQYFTQLWERFTSTYEECLRKLRHPKIQRLEDNQSATLAALRSVIARNYGFLIQGLGDTYKYYHLKGETISLSEKERHLFELLVPFSVRVVWIALQRKYLDIIEFEMNRLLRTNIFNQILHEETYEDLFQNIQKAQEKLLIGYTFKKERTLFHRSPLIQEVIFRSENYRLMGIGLFDVGVDAQPPLDYLEVAYIAPEELLNGKAVGLGILGVPRTELDSMLIIKSNTTYDLVPFKLSDYTGTRLMEMLDVPTSLPKEIPKYQETDQTKRARSDQCLLWQKYIVSNDDDSVTNPSDLASSH